MAGVLYIFFAVSVKLLVRLMKFGPVLTETLSFDLAFSQLRRAPLPILMQFGINVLGRNT